MKAGLVRKNLDLYSLLIPGLAFVVIFKYFPMYGIAIAFQDFNIFGRIDGSEWVGLENFERLVTSEEFLRVFSNTLIISVSKICFLFPIPIVIAIMMNEILVKGIKRTIQTIIYLPHFLSWVIIAGLFINILSESGGVVNNVLRAFGAKPISFLMDNRWFRAIVVFSAGWKEIGWNTIVFLAAIASIDPELYEAAYVDGAGRLSRIIHVTLPGMASVIVLMFILRVGMLMDAGTEQILTLYNPVVYDTGDVIGTFVYRVGLGKMDYSFSTAVGLFNSVIAFILVMGGNALSKALVQRSIW